MKKITLYISSLSLFLLCFSTNVQAQDIHFSQFYSMPVLLNPSLTGHIPGQYRANAIYRNQWSGFENTSGSIYNTIGGAFDMNFKKNDSNNSYGAGLGLFSDNSGAGDIKSLGVMLSGAYHYALTSDAKRFLSVGLQGAYLSKRLDISNILFEDQIDTNTGASTGATNVQFDDTNTANFDIRAGLTYSAYPSNKLSYQLGLSFMHLTKPNESFLGDTDNQLPNRLVLHGQASIGLNEQFSLRPHILYMTQKEAAQLNLGATVAYQSSDDLSIYLGGGYRNEGAMIFLAGLGLKNINLGIAYDNDISDLNSNGAFEVSLGYIGTIFQEAEAFLPCIRFY